MDPPQKAATEPEEPEGEVSVDLGDLEETGAEPELDVGEAEEMSLSEASAQNLYEKIRRERLRLEREKRKAEQTLQDLTATHLPQLERELTSVKPRLEEIDRRVFMYYGEIEILRRMLEEMRRIEDQPMPGRLTELQAFVQELQRLLEGYTQKLHEITVKLKAALQDLEATRRLKQVLIEGKKRDTEAFRDAIAAEKRYAYDVEENEAQKAFYETEQKRCRGILAVIRGRSHRDATLATSLQQQLDQIIATNTAVLGEREGFSRQCEGLERRIAEAKKRKTAFERMIKDREREIANMSRVEAGLKKIIELLGRAERIKKETPQTRQRLEAWQRELEAKRAEFELDIALLISEVSRLRNETSNAVQKKLRPCDVAEHVLQANARILEDLQADFERSLRIAAGMEEPEGIAIDEVLARAEALTLHIDHTVSVSLPSARTATEDQDTFMAALRNFVSRLEQLRKAISS